jgi:Ser/Thr protein kinase RdoA (MazF antagonist)
VSPLSHIGFDALSPDVAVKAVEAAFDLELQSVITTYPSYVNRVYGLVDVDGIPYIAKFYRPGRWSREALEEEHRFTRELADEEFPVVSPLPDADGDTLAEVIVENGDDEMPFRFALFPKRGGRLFDAEGDEAWLRIGALCGRLHSIGGRDKAPHRQIILPQISTRSHLESLDIDDIVPADLRNEFRDIVEETLGTIIPSFEGLPMIRLHGDLHRANILDRGDEGLLLIDMDDMSVGPAMQDLWLLLPGRRHEVGKELALLSEGYESFRPFPWEQVRLMEALRFMRMIHFIAWCARQRRDRDFHHHFPDWGSRGWWLRELEDLRDQRMSLGGN